MRWLFESWRTFRANFRRCRWLECQKRLRYGHHNSSVLFKVVIAINLTSSLRDFLMACLHPKAAGELYLKRRAPTCLIFGCSLLAELNATNNGEEGSTHRMVHFADCQPGTAGEYLPAYGCNRNIIALVSTADSGTTAHYEYGPFGELLRAPAPMAKTRLLQRTPV